MINPGVRDHIPLEQGLRQREALQVSDSCLVRDHIPLEQGLRLRTARPLPPIVTSQRPYSIRTRIKTPIHTITRQSIRVRDHIPLEQGLRPIPQQLHVVVLVSETIFH